MLHASLTYREEWKPVLNLQSVILGLLYLFLVCGRLSRGLTPQEPNPDDPLNKVAGKLMKENRSQFEKVGVCVVVALRLAECEDSAAWRVGGRREV
jgi:ubiquitin-protein ligase